MYTFNDPLAHLLGNWAETLTMFSIILRLCLSLVFSAIIGYERAEKRHSAGLRTFMLVTMSSTVSMIIDLFIINQTNIKFPVLSAATIIASAMLSGNSILFSSKNQIKGLTTSTALWAFSILGLVVGAGLYTVSIILFIFLILVTALATKIEKAFKDHSNHFEINLELKNKNNLQDFVTTLRKFGLKIDDIESNPAFVGSGLSVYSITLTIQSNELKKFKTHSEIIEALSSLDYVNHIEEI